MTSGSGSDTTERMRIAVLDLGTNTFNLLIGEQASEQDELRILFTDRYPVKLGKEGMEEGLISKEAQERGIEAILAHLKSCREWEVAEWAAIATSGIRSSRNGDRFLEELRKRTGLVPEVIEGEHEAELIGEGIRAAVPLDRTPVLGVDIGGGSSEFLIMDRERTHWKRSFEIGAARMLAHVNPKDPIEMEEVQKAETYIRKTIQPLEAVLKEIPVKTLIGCSGSFESISDMAFHRFPDASDPREKASVEVSLEHFQRIHRALLGSTLNERRNMKGLAEMRAEMIVLGSVMIRTVMDLAGIERLFTSYYALREGALRRTMKDRNEK